jgi:hypothetical protein
MLNRIASGVLASLLVAGSMIGINAAPASAYDHPVLQADVDAWQVSLQGGHEVKSHSANTTVSSLKKWVGQTLTGASLTKNVFTLSPDSDARDMSGAVQYEIVMLGKPTGFWLMARMFFDGRYKADCHVFSSADGQPANPSPFTCSVMGPFDWEYNTKGRFVFNVGLNRDAESSGAITPKGDVALRNGVYNTFTVPYADHGSSSVDSNDTTRFDTVLRVGDSTPYTNQARTEFAYQIYDKGVPMDYWVAGLSTNYRGWAQFNGDGRCAIYGHNPLANEGHLDLSSPLSAGAPYTCTADGSYQHGAHYDGNGHFFTQFTVVKR